jgi:hypothetical protein
MRGWQKKRASSRSPSRIILSYHRDSLRPGGKHYSSAEDIHDNEHEPFHEHGAEIRAVVEPSIPPGRAILKGLSEKEAQSMNKDRGQVMPETVNTAHRGIVGDQPATFIVFYAGAKGMDLFHASAVTCSPKGEVT